MSRLVPLKCQEIETRLFNLAFTLDHTAAGSMRYYTRDFNGVQSIVQIHWHPEERGVPVIRSIIRNAGVTRREWEEAKVKKVKKYFPE